MKAWLDKAGSIGSVVAAAACPACFPKLALVGALFGFGALSAYEYQLFIAAQVLVGVAMVGAVPAYLRHRNGWLLGAALGSGAAVFAGLYLFGSEWIVYTGLAGLAATSATDLWKRIVRRRSMPITESVITCPKCGVQRRETMPTDACLFFYQCTGCGERLRPKAADCCVFCSYGSVKCPPMQAA
jgi:hypothetical protein